jgi:hypothetical protein
MKSEKAIIPEKDYGSIRLTNQTNSKENDLTMNDCTPRSEKPQLNFGSPPKTLETIHCRDCHKTRPLDGYRFGLVPLCSDCRTERSLEILSNQIERRAKR